MIVRHTVLIPLCALIFSSSAFAVPVEADKATSVSVAGQQALPAPVVEGSLDKEIRGVREQLAAAPAESILHTRLGYLLLKKGIPDEARLLFAEALKLSPRSHAALTGEGIVLSRKGNLREAEQTLKAALVQNPDPVRTHYELGVVYEKLGEFDKALHEYKEGITKHQQGRK
ncbi:MAG: tetratricopeptide repeat protein [Geobacteraceae bacterium]|nr:tetratricopeptide repeat protein [Geobacteraceae bacterium]